MALSSLSFVTVLTVFLGVVSADSDSDVSVRGEQFLAGVPLVTTPLQAATGACGGNTTPECWLCSKLPFVTLGGQQYDCVGRKEYGDTGVRFSYRLNGLSAAVKDLSAEDMAVKDFSAAGFHDVAGVHLPAEVNIKYYQKSSVHTTQNFLTEEKTNLELVSRLGLGDDIEHCVVFGCQSILNPDGTPVTPPVDDPLASQPGRRGPSPLLVLPNREGKSIKRIIGGNVANPLAPSLTHDAKKYITSPQNQRRAREQKNLCVRFARR